MPIRFQKIKALILSSCLFYPYNFCVSVEGEPPIVPEDSKVVPVTLEKLKESLDTLIGKLDPDSTEAKKLGHIEDILSSDSFAPLPQFRMDQIAGIIGVGLTDKSPEYKQSLFGLLEESKTNPEVLGFYGSPIGFVEVFSRMNEILMSFLKENVLKKIGEPTYTALSNGNSIWARGKFLYDDLKTNTEELIIQTINDADSGTKRVIIEKCTELKTQVDAFEEENDHKTRIKENVSDIEGKIQSPECLPKDPSYTTLLDELSDLISGLKAEIESISLPMESIPDPMMDEKVKKMNAAVKQMSLSMEIMKDGLRLLDPEGDNTAPLGVLQQNLKQIEDRDLISKLQKVIGRMNRVLMDPMTLQKLGNPDQFSIYDSETFSSKLYLVQDSLETIFCTLTKESLVQYSSKVSELLDDLATVINSDNRKFDLDKADEKITSLYKDIVQYSLSGVSDTFFLPLPEGVNISLPEGANISEERSATVKEITDFKNNNGSESSPVPVNLGKIIRTSFYKWPKICAQIKASPDSKEIWIGEKIQGGATLINCLNEIRQALLSDKTLFRIGQMKDTADSNSLIGHMRKKGIDTLVDNFETLSLVRYLLQTCPAINFISVATTKEAEREGDTPEIINETFITWIDKTIGSPTDIEDSLFGLVQSLPEPENLPLEPSTFSGDPATIESIKTGIDKIVETLNNAVREKGNTQEDSLIAPGWHDYKEIFQLLLNEKKPNDLKEKLQYQFYSVPLLFRVNGILGTDKKGTLLSRVKGGGVQGNENDSWMLFNPIGTQRQTSYSVVNFFSRSVSECAPYLNLSMSDKTLFSSIDESLTSFNESLTPVSGADAFSIDKLFSLTLPLFDLVGSIFVEDADGVSTIAGTEGESPLSTAGEEMVRALKIMGLDPSALGDRINLVKQSIQNAQGEYFPTRFKEILKSLYQIQKNLDSLKNNIPSSVDAVTLDQKSKIRSFLGTGKQETLASRSIFGCVNDILKECGAQFLINLIGTSSRIEEGTLIGIITEKMSISSSAVITEKLQKVTKSLRELSGKIKSSYETFLEEGSSSLSSAANQIYILRDTLMSEGAYDFPDITNKIQDVFKLA